MDSTKYTEAILVLVTGLPGVGKSTVARLIAKNIKAEVITADEVRRELFPEERTYTSEETGVVIREMRSRIRRSLEKGLPVVVDALFTKERAREEYRMLAAEAGVTLRIVLVTAPAESAKRWMASRRETGDASEATFAYHLDRKRHFEPVAGEHVVIENSGSIAELSARIDEAFSVNVRR